MTLATSETMWLHDFAAQSNVSPGTVRNWIDRGTIRAERVGPRLIRVYPSTLVTTPVVTGGGNVD